MPGTKLKCDQCGAEFGLGAFAEMAVHSRQHDQAMIQNWGKQRVANTGCFSCEHRFQDPCDPCIVTGGIIRKGWKAKL